MDAETLGAAGLGFGLLTASVYNGWQTVQAKREAKHARTEACEAKSHASDAADNSRPVSNGFTAEVRTGLADILAIATEARDLATSASSHAERACQLGEENRDAHTRHLEAHANGLTGATYPRAVAP